MCDTSELVRLQTELQLYRLFVYQSINQSMVYGVLQTDLSSGEIEGELNA